MRVVRTIASAGAALALTVLPAAAASAQTAPDGMPLPAATTRPGTCTTADQNAVTLVIDYQALGGGVHTTCVSGLAKGAYGYAVLQEAGANPVGTTHDGAAFVCRLNGRPNPTEKIPITGNPNYTESCQNTPPSEAYWSYWQAAPGGTWVYSSRGPQSSRVQFGGFEGWSYSLNATSGTNPRPRVDPVTPNPSTGGGDSGSGGSSSGGSGGSASGGGNTSGGTGGTTSGGGTSGGTSTGSGTKTSGKSTSGSKATTGTSTQQAGSGAATSTTAPADPTSATAPDAAAPTASESPAATTATPSPAASPTQPDLDLGGTMADPSSTRSATTWIAVGALVALGLGGGGFALYRRRGLSAPGRDGAPPTGGDSGAPPGSDA